MNDVGKTEELKYIKTVNKLFDSDTPDFQTRQ